jgi:aminopeptidase N
LALEEISTSQDRKDVFSSVTNAMNDPSFHVRILALNKLNLINKYAKEDAIKKVESLAKSDLNTLVRAAANTTLAKLVNPKYINHFIGALESESFSVVESAVIGLYELDKENTLKKVDALPEKVKDNMSPILTGYYIERHDEKDMPYIGKYLTRGLFFVQKKNVADAYMGAFEWIARSDSQEAIGNLVSSLVKTGIKFKKQGGKEAAVNFLRQMQHLQKDSTHSNKRELEGLIRVGMAKLIS